MTNFGVTLDESEADSARITVFTEDTSLIGSTLELSLWTSFQEEPTFGMMQTIRVEFILTSCYLTDDQLQSVGLDVAEVYIEATKFIEPATVSITEIIEGANGIPNDDLVSRCGPLIFDLRLDEPIADFLTFNLSE